MKYDPGQRHRRSIRLHGYDYTQAGACFITVCTHNRECLFGDVVDGEMRLNEIGLIVQDEWMKTAVLRPCVVLDAFVVMPNHVHGIIVLTGDCRGTLQRAPTDHRAPTAHGTHTIEQFGKPTSNSIPTIVRLFKSAATKRINEYRRTLGVPIWQRNYYEHVIRSEESLKRIREYIVHNPSRWAMDQGNPARVVVAATIRSPQQDEPWCTWANRRSRTLPSLG